MLNQIEFRQQPCMSLALLMLLVQFKVQLTLEVAQSELRSPIPIVSDNTVSPHGLPLASTERRFTNLKFRC